uniref:Down syndrome cell adhesion molecule-like protein Dscam2 n=1 Tax=Macrostomum lignano TaxID=282301 RepID=A0A1I8H8X8_9PLAT
SSPKFTKRPSDGTGVIANSISFDCAATGAPAPKILWHKDKIPIVHTERVQQRPDGSLSITRLVANDAGEYECIATSETGTIRASSVLAVYNRTRVSPRPAARVEAAKGSNAQLNCSAVADSRLANRLTVSWTYRPTFGGESYRPVVTGVTGRSVSTGTSLALGNLRSSDAGLYRCQADAGPAGGGPDEAEIQLTVIELPTSPGPPITGLLTADHGSSDGINSDCQLLGGIRVTWPEAEFDGNSPLTGYAVQYQINGDSPDIWRAAKKVNRDSADGLFQKRSVCLSASVLQTSGVAYRFRVLAVNKLGFSTGSRPSDWVFLPSRPPSGPPQSFFLFGGESNSSLRASWEPPKPRHRQGRLLGYQIRHVGYPAGVSERLLNVTEPDVTSALLTDLQPNTEYNAWIAAVNEQGRGPWTSPAKTARTAEGRPLSAPAGVTVAPVTPRSARIEFDALLRAQLPGRLVSYSIVAECQAEAVAADLAPEEAPEPCERVEKLVSHVDTASRVSVVLDGLRPHTSYQVSVRAKTGAGFGPASAPPVAMETVPDAPGPPRGQLTVTRVRDTAARIGWKPPLRPNGIVTGYRVSWKPTVATDAASTLLHSNDAGSVDVKDVRRYDLTGLRPSTRYQVGVSAVNSAGVGASAIVEFVTRSRATAPDAPRQLRQVGVLARSARLQFLPPLSDGGAPVTAWLPEVQRAVAPVSTGSSLMTEDGHRSVGEAPVGGDWVAMKELPVPDGDSDRWRPEESQQLLLQGLRPFTRYRVRLSAKNSRGVSSPSAPPSDWFITMATLPEKPPANLTLRVRSATQLAARWLPLESEAWCGPALGYQVQLSPADQEVSNWQNATNGRISDPSGSYHLLESLQPSRRYRVRVMAVGLAGSIASSAVEAVTWDSAPLTAPKIVSARVQTSSSGGWSISVRLDQLNDSSGVTGYQVAAFDANSDPLASPKTAAIFAEIDADRLTGVIADGDNRLKPDTEYRVAASALNRRGRGPWTPLSEIFTVQTPSSSKPFEPPEWVYFDWSTKGVVKVCWLPPRYPGVELTSYRIRWGDNTVDRPVNELCYSPPATTTKSNRCRNSVLVAGLSSGGSAEGPSARAPCPPSLDGESLPSHPPVPESASTIELTSNTAEIQWVQNLPEPRNFTVLIEDLTRNASWKQNIDMSSVRTVSSDASSGAMTLRATVYGLQPYRLYQFRLRARGDVASPTELGWSSPTPNRRTQPSAPQIAPNNVILASHGKSGVRVAWKPLQGNSDWACNPKESTSLAAYRLTFQSWSPEELMNSEEPQKQSHHQRQQLSRQEKLNWKATETEVTGLAQDVYYEVSLAAENVHGTGPASELQLVYVGEAAPEAPPTSLLCRPGVSDVVCSWEAPALDKQNGPLLGYRLYYETASSTVDSGYSDSGSVTVPSSKRETRLDWLRPYSNYRFAVCSVNPAGEGPNSTATDQVRTPQARPGLVDNFRAIDVTTNEATLMWSRPSSANGIVTKYRLRFAQHVSTEAVSSSRLRRSSVAAPSSTSRLSAPYVVTIAEPSSSYRVDRLADNAAYEFAIAAATAAGWGAESVINVTTGPTRGSPKTPDLIACTAEQSGVRINWTILQADIEANRVDHILVQSIVRHQQTTSKSPPVWQLVDRFSLIEATKVQPTGASMLISWDRFLTRGSEHQFRLIASKLWPPTVKISSPSRACDWVAAPLSVGGSSGSAMYEQWWFLSVTLTTMCQSDTNGSSGATAAAARLASGTGTLRGASKSGSLAKNGHHQHFASQQQSDRSELILACDIPNEPADGSASLLLPSQHLYPGGRQRGSRPLSAVGRVSIKQLKSAPRPSPAAAIRPVEMSTLSSNLSPPKSSSGAPLLPVQEKKVAINLDKNSEWRTLDHRRGHQQHQQHQAPVAASSAINASGYASLRKAKPPEPFNPGNVPTIGVPVG